VTAHPYVGEVGNPDSIRSTLQAIRSDHGPISMIALTAYRGSDVNDVLSAQPEQIGQAFDIGVTGLLTITQASLPDLRSAQDAAVLVLNGAVATTRATRTGTRHRSASTALHSNAPPRQKPVGLLAEGLRGDDIYVGELVISGTIKGSPYASPTASTRLTLLRAQDGLGGRRHTNECGIGQIRASTSAATRRCFPARLYPAAGYRGALSRQPFSSVDDAESADV
jgi:NAD(P)-dependent dehydrogenase (short-subunit alcohol dehydrogenase family)